MFSCLPSLRQVHSIISSFKNLIWIMSHLVSKQGLQSLISNTDSNVVSIAVSFLKNVSGMYLLSKIQKINGLVHTYTYLLCGRDKTRILSRAFPREWVAWGKSHSNNLEGGFRKPQLASISVWHWKSHLTALRFLFPCCEVQALD